MKNDYPEKMLAAILVEQNKPLVVDEVELPSKLECGQVLVKLFFSGICGSQIGEIDGVKGPDKFLPHLLGHEASGEVIAIGDGVKTVKPNDRVVLHWRKGRGIESVPPVYKWNGQNLNAGAITTFNEYAIVSENRATVIPADFDMSLAPLFGCAVTTGFGVALNNARIKIGESIVVFGAGGVGLNVIQAASMSSAYPVIAVDLYDNRLALAGKLGADYLINSKKCDAKAKILEILGASGADVIVDNTGNPKVIELAYELTKPQGRVVLVGVPKKGNNINIYSLPLHFGKTITGSHGGESDPAEDIPRYLKLASVGKLNLKELVTDHFSLVHINDALNKMRSGEIVGRCMIDINLLKK